MNMQLKRVFSFQTRNALHIRPPLTPTKVKLQMPFREIKGLKLPIYEEIPTGYTPVPPPSAQQFNDAIAENHVGVKILRLDNNHIQNLVDKYRTEDTKVPFIFEDRPKVPYTSFTVTSKEFQTSAKKATVVMALTINQYFYDALIYMDNLEKKVARFAAETLREKVLVEIEDRQLDPRYLWISAAVVNRRRRVKSIRYHARGRAGMKKRDYCVLKFTLSERPIREFYKQLIIGRAPPHLAYLIQQEVFSRQMSFEELRTLQPLVHARGRQQQRLMFNRKVLTRWIELKMQGAAMRMKLLREKMLEEEAIDFEKRFGYLFETPQEKAEKRLERRRELFEKNQQENA